MNIVDSTNIKIIMTNIVVIEFVTVSNQFTNLYIGNNFHVCKSEDHEWRHNCIIKYTLIYMYNNVHCKNISMYSVISQIWDQYSLI